MAVHENTSIPSVKQSRFSQITLLLFRIRHQPNPSAPNLATVALDMILNSPRLLGSITYWSKGR